MDILTTLFSIIILIISVMFHELAHGITADKLGDPTPGLAGRLTLNPIAHLELVGSFLLPMLCILSGGGFIIGWAKPVPYNPRNLKNPRWGSALVAAAGPITNIIIALLATIVFRFVNAPTTMLPIIVAIIAINISLAIFNLIPIPPLDGHHIVGAIIPKFRTWSDQLMQSYGIVLMIIVVFIAGWFIGPVISAALRLLLGI